MKMKKYRKKPITIEAFQWFPRMGEVGGVKYYSLIKVYGIETLEGVMKVTAGDWIITGVMGEKYPCKPDIFEATYEEAPEE